MILPDVNILLYAHNKDDQKFGEASVWLKELLSGATTACFCWETINGFIRVSTNPKAMPSPITLEEAFTIVADWMAAKNSTLLQPTDRHLEVLRKTASDAGVRGSLFSDAVLAALAIDHGATLATTDQDFSRFDGLKIINPLAG